MTSKELIKLERLLIELREIIHEGQQECINSLYDNCNPSYEQYNKEIRDFHNKPDIRRLWEEIHSIEIEIINKIPEDLFVYSKKIDGDVMSVEDFIDNVDCGGLIDYDGWGYLMFNDKETQLQIIPSQIRRGGLDLRRYSGVSWYNR